MAPSRERLRCVTICEGEHGCEKMPRQYKHGDIWPRTKLLAKDGTARNN